MARSASSKPGFDLYAEVTQQIAAALGEANGSLTLPWHRLAGPPQNVFSKARYRGVNTVLLWIAAQAAEFETPLWGTFKQWQAQGACVRSGETATRILFWKSLQRVDEQPGEADSSGDDAQTGKAFVARTYCVFNADQVDGFDAPAHAPLSEALRDQQAEAFFAALPLTVRHEGSQAFYSPQTDTIHLPPYAQFLDANGYYAVRAHETIHATGATHRLDRDLRGRFGSENYAGEELVAELGAAFLCAHLSLSPEPRADHSHYIASWLKVLQNDSRAIFVAAGKAQRAVDWLLQTVAGPAPTGTPATVVSDSAD